MAPKGPPDNGRGHGPNNEHIRTSWTEDRPRPV